MRLQPAQKLRHAEEQFAHRVMTWSGEVAWQIDSWQVDTRMGRQKNGFKDVWLWPLKLEKRLDKSNTETDSESDVWGKWKEEVKSVLGKKASQQWKEMKTRPKSALELAVRHEIARSCDNKIFRSDDACESKSELGNRTEPRELTLL